LLAGTTIATTPLLLKRILFVESLYDMCSEPSGFGKGVGFSSDGKCLEIRDTGFFAENVLPFYFKHNKFQSFCRQLNSHGFRATKKKIEQHAAHTFVHEMFQENRSDLLASIVRKRCAFPKLDVDSNDARSLKKATRRDRKLVEGLEKENGTLREEAEKMAGEAEAIAKDMRMIESIHNMIVALPMRNFPDNLVGISPPISSLSTSSVENVEDLTILFCDERALCTSPFGGDSGEDLFLETYDFSMEGW